MALDTILLKKYADFLVRRAVNVQKGQTLIIDCPVDGAFFARMCAEAAYENGAREVVIHYEDQKASRIRLQHADVAVLEDVKPWRLRSYLDYAETEGGTCRLRIMANDPEIYKGLDAERVDRASQAVSKAMRPWIEMTMGSQVPWSIGAIPGEAWAAKVFPGVPAKEAMEKLWDVIFQTCRVAGGNPVEEWDKHVAALRNYRIKLNNLKLDSLHLKSGNGTDLVVGLAENYDFGGAEEASVGGINFLPNIPTEEVFTAPHRLRVNGVVKSSMPFVYNGNLIEDITVRFQNGLAVEYSALRGADLLDQMLATDDGAKRLGEIALVPASSPIRQTGLLFYNTLFDENAACHMAFGAGYPGTVEGGNTMSKDELLQHGVNDSLIHEDIMIGTADMDIDGIGKSGERTPIFRQGEWVL